MSEDKPPIEQDTLQHADTILICGEHKLVKSFPAGTTWGEIEAVIDAHKKEFHS